MNTLSLTTIWLLHHSQTANLKMRRVCVCLCGCGCACAGVCVCVPSVEVCVSICREWLECVYTYVYVWKGILITHTESIGQFWWRRTRTLHITTWLKKCRIGEPCTGIKFANGIWEHVNNRFVGVNLVLPFGGRNRNSKLKLIENLTFSDGTTYRLRLVMFGEVYRFLYFWTCSDACDVRQSSLCVTRGILP